MDIFVKYVLYFFAYAFLGWVCEVIYCSILQHRFVNRGFLHMPICPIYGYGSVACILVLSFLIKYPVVIFFLGMFLVTLLEYVTSFVLEKVFKMSWWDYSKYKFNIHGRVCLKNSLMFGILIMVLMYGIHPLTVDLVNLFPETLALVVAFGLLTMMVIDTIFTTIKLTNFSKYLHEIATRISTVYKKRFENYSMRFPNLKINFSKARFVQAKQAFERLKDKLMGKNDEDNQNGTTA